MYDLDIYLSELVDDLEKLDVHLCELDGQLCITNGHFGAHFPTMHSQIALRTAHHFQKTGAGRLYGTST